MWFLVCTGLVFGWLTVPHSGRRSPSVALSSSHLISPSTHSFLLYTFLHLFYPTTFFSPFFPLFIVFLHSCSLLQPPCHIPLFPHLFFYYSIFPLSSRCDSHDSLILLPCLVQIGLCESISFCISSLILSVSFISLFCSHSFFCLPCLWVCYYTWHHWQLHSFLWK